ncbi:MAG: DUF2726 domain-containing protein [Patescibacteria group bacterium]
MTKIILLLLVIWIIGVAIKAASTKEKFEEANKEDDNNYFKKEYLLNIPERHFFEILQTLLPPEYVCYPQIVISSILNVRDKNRFWYYQNKINRKTIDFVIFKKQYLEPVLAIEYDGWTHQKAGRIKRDNFVNEIIKKSNLSIVHIKHGEEDLESVIRLEIITKL